MIDNNISQHSSFYKDDITGIEFSLYDLILDLRKRVEYLEKENIGLTNELYELQNSIDALKYQQSVV